MVNVQAAPVKGDSAVLASVLVPLKDILAGEFHLFFRQAIENTEHDNPGNPDPQGDGLEHPWLGIGGREIPPTQEIVRHVITRVIGSNHLGMSLVEKRQRPSSGTGVDCLPQPVEHENRLIE
jgi:hypothetical protein